MDKKIDLSRKRLAVAIAMVCGTAAPSMLTAQENQQGIEEITVTGSRIQRQTGFTTPVPVTAVTSDELQSILPGTTVADQLDMLPQFFNTQSAQRGGGALFGGAGRSNVNLRGMGSQRTLVLLDGARISPADRDGSVHIDNIPTALLQQVEVVTGGASAAYGADALAGVLNFRLNREFTGLDFSVGAGTTDDGFGDNTDLSIAYGTEIGDRFHFIGSAQVRDIDPIDPDPTQLGSWFQRQGIVENPAWTAGDTSQPQRLVLPNVHSTVHTPTGRISTSFDASGAAVPFSQQGMNFSFDGSATVPFAAGDIVGVGTGNQSGGPEADIANLAFNVPVYGAEVKQRNAFVGLTFDVNDTTRLWFNGMVGETESNDIDRRGIQHGTFPWSSTVFVDNAFLPADVRAAMIAEGVDWFRLEKQGEVLGVEGNMNVLENRRNSYESWTGQIGLDKQVNDNWNLQVRLQRGATDRDTQVLNENRVDRKYLGMDAVEVYADRRDEDGDGIVDLVAEADRGSGDIICNVNRYTITEQDLQDAVDGVLVPAPQGDSSLGGPTDRVPIPSPVGPEPTISGCVPFNVLGQGNVSQEAIEYTESWKGGLSAVTQEFAEALLTGDIYEGVGAGPFSMAVGATWRKQWFWQIGLPVDEMRFGPPTNAPDIGIRGIPPGYTGGSPNLHEFSTVPVISGEYDVREAFAEFNLPLWDNGTQRLELDVSGRNSDYSTSGSVPSWKFGVNFQATDWLRLRGTSSRDVREPTFAERFNRQGGGGSIEDPEFNDATFEITVTSGGNPNLEPEEADTLTAGFVVQPTVAPGLQFSMDFYDIDLDGAVGQLGQQRIVDECFEGATDLCALVRRSSTGVVTNVDNVFLNISEAAVRGIDYELLYNREVDVFTNRAETLDVRLLAGRLLEDSTTVSGGVPDDLAGSYGEPDLSGLYNVQYRVGGFGVRLQQRYLAPTVLNRDWIEGIDIDDNSIQSKLYTDLTLLWDAASAGGANWQLSLAITNLFDVDPPVVPDFSQRFSALGVAPNPAPGVQGFNSYDVYGRRYMLNFRYSL